MQDQLKTLRSESKGNSSSKVSSAADELQFLMDFNCSITQAAAKSMEHLSEVVFISMGNLIFIALIHPIQWTIAYPVGADRPAKRQKKTSCVSTG